MSEPRVFPLDRPQVAPRTISSRLRSQLVYFARPAGTPDLPPLQENEYYFDAQEVGNWLSEGVILLISPLDTAKRTEVELSEEQEAFLSWLQQEGIQHVRVQD